MSSKPPSSSARSEVAPRTRLIEPVAVRPGWKRFACSGPSACFFGLPFRTRLASNGVGSPRASFCGLPAGAGEFMARCGAETGERTPFERGRTRRTGD